MLTQGFLSSCGASSAVFLVSSNPRHPAECRPLLSGSVVSTPPGGAYRVEGDPSMVPSFVQLGLQPAQAFPKDQFEKNVVA